MWESAGGFGSISDGGCTRTWAVRLQTSRRVQELAGSRRTCSILEEVGCTGYSIFFDAPFGGWLSRGGGITSMVRGIVGTGEVLLVAGTARLRAVTLV